MLVITPPQHEALTTVERARAELKRCHRDDDWLRDNIERVSSAFAEHLERPLTRRVVEQMVPGGGRTTLMLDMTPVAALSSVQGRGYDSPLSLTDGSLRVANSEAGIIWRLTGWPDDSPIQIGLTTDVMPYLGEASWTVRYTGGWLVPADNFSGAGVVVTATGDLQMPTGRVAPLLVPGDVVRLTGFATGVDGRRVVTARTDGTISFGITMPAGTGDVGALVEVSNLPGTLERLVFDTLQHWASNRGQDTRVTAERIGDWSATYGSRDQSIDQQASTVLPRAVLNGLRKWERVA